MKSVDAVAKRRTKAELMEEINRLKQQLDLLEGAETSTEHLQLLATQAPVMLRMTDDKGEFYFFSQQWQDFTGRSAAQEQRGEWLEGIHLQDREAVLAQLKRAFSRFEKFEISYRLRKKNGEYNWMLEKGNPYFDQEGNFQGYVTSVFDVSAQQAEEEMRQQQQVFQDTEDKFYQAIANINLCGITIQRDGTITFINRYMLEVTGYSQGEVVGKDFFEVFVLPQERESRRADFERAFLNQGLLSSIERTVQAKDGTARYILFRSFILNNPSGEITGITRIGEDVTTKREVEQKLSRMNDQLQDLFDNANDLIQIISLKGDILFANKAWKNKLGYTDQEIDKLNITGIVHPDYLRGTIRRLRRILRGEASAMFETVFVSKSGKPIFLEGSVTCRYEQSRPTAFRCILYDVTDRVRAEKAQQLYYRIGALVTQSNNLENLYLNIHQELGKIIDARNFYITLYNPDTHYLHFPYYVDEELDGEFRLTQRRVGKGLIEYGLAHQKPLILHDDAIEQLIKDGEVEVYNQLPRVWIGVPLRVENRITGLISLRSYRNRNTYTVKDLELLDFISGQIALAIERKQYEERLSKQTAKLNAIFESGRHLMWSVNKRLYLTSFNTNYADFIEDQWGLRPDITTNLDKIRSITITDKYYWLWQEKYERAFQGMSQYFEIKTRGQQDARKVNWWEVYLNPIFLSDGSIEEVSGIAHDITEKKKNELALMQSEEKFRDIFESFQDVYYRSDLSGVISMVSPSVAEVLGYSPEEVIGQKTDAFLGDAFKSKTALLQLMEQGILKNFETELQTKRGEKIPFLFNIRLIYNEQGEPVEVEGVARDISELKKSAEELRFAKELAEHSLKVKENFLANMSHEIRTPMNGVIGMIDLLADSMLDNTQLEYVYTIKKSSETLLTILNDILDLSKIEAGKMQLNPAPLSVEDLVSKIHTLFSQQALTKGNRLSYKIQEGVPSHLIADETRLLQVLSNFTSNAIKFTENGKILLYISLVWQEGNRCRLKVEVVDTGIGIAKEKKTLLFQHFSQIDNTSSKGYGGTGLGLAISKALVERMKGEVGVESVPNRGSIFWFTFEAEVTQVSPSSLPPTEVVFRSGNQFGKHSPLILVTDDNPVNQKVAGEILRKSGCQVELASSGEEAVAKVRQNALESRYKYDLIFMDIQMPDMDGIETTRLIRSLGLANLPPIIAMTAYAMREDRERFLQDGMDDYLPKPIKAHLMVQKVKDWMIRRSQYHQQVSNLSWEVEKEADHPIDNSLQVIDRKVLLSLKKYAGAEGVTALLEEFAAEARQQLEESQAAFKNHDIKQVLSLLHTLKGNAGTMGAEKLSNQALTAELRLKQNPEGEIGQELEKLNDNFKEFVKELENLQI
jgi:PAS domain S-box-containing protein